MSKDPPTKQVGFRFPVDLVERIDAYADKLSRDLPGLKFTRADAVRVLLERGLIEVGLGPTTVEGTDD